MSLSTLSTLAERLAWQESLQGAAIQLGLDRVRTVAQRMQLLNLPFPVMTVAGTNGKGSTCAMLTSCLVQAGYQVGTYTSPHIQHYNERIALNGVPASDSLIIEAFNAIDRARGDIHLTYFEFGTLAAIYCFAAQGVQIAVLEVGLGGRLDAVNIWDAEVAIVTSIGIDHVEWLGSDRESIGAEKAAIARPLKYLVSNDPNPPPSIQTMAQALGAKVLQYGIDFKVLSSTENQFILSTPQGLSTLPYPSLQGDIQVLNAAGVVVGLQVLGKSTNILVDIEQIAKGLSQVSLKGRLQKVSHSPDIWVDVAHNGHAAQSLAQWLLAQKQDQGKTHAVFSMLADKDIDLVVNTLQSCIDAWHVFALEGSRALPLEQLVSTLKNSVSDTTIYQYDDLKSALQGAISMSTKPDKVVAFGSFLVVSGVLEHLSPSTY